MGDILSTLEREDLRLSLKNAQRQSRAHNARRAIQLDFYDLVVSPGGVRGSSPGAVRDVIGDGEIRIRRTP